MNTSTMLRAFAAIVSVPFFAACFVAPVDSIDAPPLDTAAPGPGQCEGSSQTCLRQGDGGTVQGWCVAGQCVGCPDAGNGCDNPISGERGIVGMGAEGVCVCCSGCFSADGVCQFGSANNNCGSGGLACDTCPAEQACGGWQTNPYECRDQCVTDGDCANHACGVCNSTELLCYDGC